MTRRLKDDELIRFRRDGFVNPVRVVSAREAVALRTALQEHLRGDISSDSYELTDPIKIRGVDLPEGRRLEYEPGGRSRPHTFPFLFNLWRFDERFRRVAFDPSIVALAQDLLECSEILLMEDNAIVKLPHTGPLPWHQDFSYWPIAESSAAVTAWIALDAISAENGAMQLAPGSHDLGERLPVGFGDGVALLRDERPGASEIPQHPAAAGHRVVTYELAPGECGFHDAMVWHGSTPNTSDSPRHVYVLRYLRSGTVWQGSARMPYDDIGCEIGGRVDGRHFPVVSSAP